METPPYLVNMPVIYIVDVKKWQWMDHNIQVYMYITFLWVIFNTIFATITSTLK